MSFGLGSIVDNQLLKSKRRFNLLMLEEREYYFEDYGGYQHVADTHARTATPFASRQKLKGRLHVCSKSIVFDPDDLDVNIIRLPFREIASIKPRQASVGGVDFDYFIVHTRLSIEIPKHASYIFQKHDLGLPQSEFIFSLSYVDTQKVLEFISQLHGMYRLSSTAKPIALANLIRQREESIQFESSAIQDIRERVLFPNGTAILAQLVQPLLLCPGRLQLTDARIYFQNFNHVSSDATNKIDISDIKRIYKRRFVMKDTALEIFLPIKQSTYGSNHNQHANSPLNQTSVYFNFQSHAIRDMVYTLITTTERFQPLREQTLTSMTESWIKGNTSNFEYLLFLNQQAGRSWMDLTQYPVMPWVINDYHSSTLNLNDPAIYRDLSKPVGALNPDRLAMFKKRMRDMPEEISHGHPFLYGTHYSSPGYVLYYLVRKTPQLMLRLQSGKFDQPDRLFFSIEATWKSCLSAPTDVKELIPEFYAPATDSSSSTSGNSGPGEFLVNAQELDLGLRQNGQQVEDVVLPPWASSTNDFIRQMREALESDHVSQHLHEWIDLIFGYKQKGAEALKADNLFYYLTYEGAIDLETVDDPLQRRSLELQINEFGQTPKQIFPRAHPKRFEEYITPIEPEVEESKEELTTSTSSSSSIFTFPLPNADGGFNRVESSGELPVSPIHIDITSPFNIVSSASPTITALPMNQSLDTFTPLSPSATASTADMAAFDSGARALQMAAEVAQIQTRQLRVDENDLRKSPSAPSSTTTSSTSTTSPLKSTSAKPAWSNLNNTNQWQRRETLSLHRDTITGVQFNTFECSGTKSNLISVGSDGMIKVNLLNNGSLSKLIRSSKVSDMALSSCCCPTINSPCVFISCWDNNVYLYNLSYGRIVTSLQAHDDAVSCMLVRHDTMITGSWDTTVKIFSVSESAIQPRPLHEFAEHEAAITAVTMDQRGTIGVSGSEDGGLIMWDMRIKDGQSRQLEGFDGAVKSVDISPTSNDFLVSGRDGTLRHIDAGTGKTLFQLQTNDTINCLRTDGFTCLGIGEQGILHAWNLRGAEEVMAAPLGCGPQTTLAVSDDATIVCMANQKALLYQRGQ